MHLYEAVTTGKLLAALITSIFPDPVELEYEKTYNPFLLKGKKMYIGRLFEEDIDESKLDAKGVEIVRRDNCELLRNMCKDVQRALLPEPPFTRASILENVESAVAPGLQRLLDDSRAPTALDISKYTITKGLKRIEDYKAPKTQPHIMAAERMREQITKGWAMEPPRVGDRMMFVVTQKKGNISDKTYHPDWVKHTWNEDNAEEALRVDIKEYYFTRFQAAVLGLTNVAGAKNVPLQFNKARAKLNGNRTLMDMWWKPTVTVSMGSTEVAMKPQLIPPPKDVVDAMQEDLAAPGLSQPPDVKRRRTSSSASSSASSSSASSSSASSSSSVSSSAVSSSAAASSSTATTIDERVRNLAQNPRLHLKLKKQTRFCPETIELMSNPPTPSPTGMIWRTTLKQTCFHMGRPHGENGQFIKVSYNDENTAVLKCYKCTFSMGDQWDGRCPVHRPGHEACVLSLEFFL